MHRKENRTHCASTSQAKSKEIELWMKRKWDIIWTSWNVESRCALIEFTIFVFKFNLGIARLYRMRIFAVIGIGQNLSHFKRTSIPGLGHKSQCTLKFNWWAFVSMMECMSYTKHSYVSNATAAFNNYVNINGKCGQHRVVTSAQSQCQRQNENYGQRIVAMRSDTLAKLRALGNLLATGLAIRIHVINNVHCVSVSPVTARVPWEICANLARRFRQCCDWSVHVVRDAFFLLPSLLPVVVV